MAIALMTQSLRQLEDLLAGSNADPEMLSQLEDELRYRSVPRALALLIQVQVVRHRLGACADGPAVGSLPPASDPAL